MMTREQCLQIAECYKDKRRSEAQEGEQYIVIRDHGIFPYGERVILTSNDDTSCPYFTSTKGGKQEAVSWRKLVPADTICPPEKGRDINGCAATVKKPNIVKGIYV